MVDPIDYGSPLRNGIIAGMQGGTMLQGIGMRNRQMQQEDQQLQQQKQFQQDWQQAYSSGDPKQMDAIVAKYPGQMEAVQKAIGFRDENHRMALGNAARDLRIAMASKQPGAVGRAAQTHADTLASIGSSPEDVLQALQNDPQGLARTVDAVGMGALGVKDYYDTEHKRDQLAETVRSNKAGEGLTARGQNLNYQSAMTGHSIAQQNVNLRRMELDDKKYDRQIARETNDLKLADLQDKRAKNQQDIEQARRDKADAYNTSMDSMSRTVETAQKVLDSPGFNGYFGVNLNPFSNRFIPGTDAADTSALVDTLKSQGFMSGIQQMRGLGALSNAEGQKVMDAIGNLSASQSEESAKASIKAIISTTQKARERLQQKYGKDIPAQANEQQPQLSDDDLVSKYLGGK